MLRRLIGEEIADRVLTTSGAVEGVAQLDFHIGGEAPTFAGPGHHFVGDLLAGGGNKIVMSERVPLENRGDGLEAQITFNLHGEGR